MNRLGLFIAALLPALSIYAGNKAESNFEFTHHRASISGMLTSSCSWQVELGYHYMFNRYIGIGGTIGAWKVYFEEGFASGNNWQIDSDDTKPWNIFLRPSVILKTPALKTSHIDLGLFAESGFMMNIPYSRVWIQQITDWPEYINKSISTTAGQWCALDLRAGIYANIGPCGFSIGYVVSNHDVYSQYRHLSHKGISFSNFYPQKPIIQGAYLTLSYFFQ